MNTVWFVFREGDTTNQLINFTVYTDSVTGYITCMVLVTVTKDITKTANKKNPDSSRKYVDKEALKSTRANLQRGVRAANHAYGQKMNLHLTDTKDPRCLWQGIQSVQTSTQTPQHIFQPV